MFKMFGCEIPDEKYEQIKYKLLRKEHPVCIASAVDLSPSEIYAVEAAMRLEESNKQK